MNLAFSVRPDGGETELLVVSQQTIRPRPTACGDIKRGDLRNRGADRPFLLLWQDMVPNHTTPADWRNK